MFSLVSSPLVAGGMRPRSFSMAVAPMTHFKMRPSFRYMSLKPKVSYVLFILFAGQQSFIANCWRLGFLIVS